MLGDNVYFDNESDFINVKSICAGVAELHHPPIPGHLFITSRISKRKGYLILNKS